MGFQTFTCCICGKEGLTKRNSYAIDGKGRACREHEEASTANENREFEKKVKEEHKKKDNIFVCGLRMDNTLNTSYAFRYSKSELEIISNIHDLLSNFKDDKICFKILISHLFEFMVKSKDEGIVRPIMDCIVSMYCYIFHQGAHDDCKMFCLHPSYEQHMSRIRQWFYSVNEFKHRDPIMLCAEYICIQQYLIESWFNSAVDCANSTKNNPEEKIDPVCLSITTRYSNDCMDISGFFNVIYKELNLKEKIGGLSKYVDAFLENGIKLKQHFLDGKLSIKEVKDAMDIEFINFVTYMKQPDNKTIFDYVLNHHDARKKVIDNYTDAVKYWSSKGEFVDRKATEEWCYALLELKTF